MLLEQIQQENDIKKIPPEQLEQLAEEIRQFLIAHISETGGHLASNLGVVELTMALHYVLQLPEDKIIWDVGHQSYVHKLLTGRQEGFATLRQKDGMSGFPKRKESPCDAFETGHSSTSISAGLGYVQARDLSGEDYTVVSVIGDGAMTGGMALEALNNIPSLTTNFMVVLNDNNMSIAENVGGVSKLLNTVRTNEGFIQLKSDIEETFTKNNVGKRAIERMRNTKNRLRRLLLPNKLFENMGITYLGPVDGHDIGTLIRAFQRAKLQRGGVIVHVLTEKGKGYEPAQANPRKFHGLAPFYVATGEPRATKDQPCYTDIFSASVKALGERHPELVAVTAAMPDGTGLSAFGEEFPRRFFDVGIAEEHAVTFAAGMAAGGMHPVVAVYSSFLQRAYDQILHDVCMQQLPVIFAIDRAGFVGSDGETHQGVFDLSYLSSIPGMTVMAPKNRWELHQMLRFAVGFQGPVAIRYPKGTASGKMKEYSSPIEHGVSETLCEGKHVVLLAVGSMVETAMDVREQLLAGGIDCGVVNARFVKPLDEAMLARLAQEYDVIVTMEENVVTGGFGQQVEAFVRGRDLPARVEIAAIPDRFVCQATVAQQRAEAGLDVGSVCGLVRSALDKTGKKTEKKPGQKSAGRRKSGGSH